jgi:transposase
VEVLLATKTETEASAMQITTVGIDLAKNVFQVHGVDERGKVVLRRMLKRSQVAVFFAGIGVLTATALAATVGNARNFENGRQMAAWLGLVPRQHSSGGKQNLLGMSKRGDAYLRTLLIHGARSVVYRATERDDPENWISKLTARRNKNVAAVALANKTARIAWALLAHGREFRSDYTTHDNVAA